MSLPVLPIYIHLLTRSIHTTTLPPFLPAHYHTGQVLLWLRYSACCTAFLLPLLRFTACRSVPRTPFLQFGFAAPPGVCVHHAVHRTVPVLYCTFPAVCCIVNVRSSDFCTPATWFLLTACEKKRAAAARAPCHCLRGAFMHWFLRYAAPQCQRTGLVPRTCFVRVYHTGFFSDAANFPTLRFCTCRRLLYTTHTYLMPLYFRRQFCRTDFLPLYAFCLCAHNATVYGSSAPLLIGYTTFVYACCLPVTLTTTTDLRLCGLLHYFLLPQQF